MKRLLAATLAALLSTAAHAATLSATPASVYNLVKTAHPGDAVELDSGSYGALNLWAIPQAAPGVIIRPAAGATPQISAINADQSTWLIFRGLEVKVTAATQYAIAAPGASNLTFDHLTVHQADLSLTGVGAFLRNASAITFSNSEFHHLGVGLQALDSSAMTVSGNSLHDINSDAIDLYGTDKSTVSGNQIHDLRPGLGDHPDAIQLAATSTHPQPSGNVVSGNTYLRGSGDATTTGQGVFVEDQANLTIRGNALRCPMYNGIGLSRVKGATISGNFVQGCPDMGTRIIVRGASDSVAITGNTVTLIVDYAADGVNTNLTQSGNTIIADAASLTDFSAYNAWLAAQGTVTPPTAVDPLQATVDSLTAQVASLTTQLTTANAQISTLKAQLAAALAKITKAKTDLN